MMSEAQLCQIAISVMEMEETVQFYQEVFGFKWAGETYLCRGPIASKIQGLPKVAARICWLINKQDFLQLELFQFEVPVTQPHPSDKRPCDIGYNRISLQVDDFEACLQRLHQNKIPTLTEPVSWEGTRRVCAYDPNHVMLEIIEMPTHETFPSPRIVGVAASVPNLEKSRRFFVEGLGARELESSVPDREFLWGLEGAQREVIRVDLGNCWLEIVQYTSPAPKPWPADYQISDQGFLNIALGYREHGPYIKRYHHCSQMGYHGNSEPMNFGTGHVVYINDDQGFSVELLQVSPWADSFLGYKPHTLGIRAFNQGVKLGVQAFKRFS